MIPHYKGNQMSNPILTRLRELKAAHDTVSFEMVQLSMTIEALVGEDPEATDEQLTEAIAKFTEKKNEATTTAEALSKYMEEIGLA